MSHDQSEQEDTPLAHAFLNRGKRMWKKIALSFLIAIILVAIIGRFVDWQMFWVNLQQFKPVPLFGALAMSVLYQYLRALRMRAVLPDLTNKSTLFLTFNVQSGLNNLLPLGLSEVALAVMMRQFHGIDIFKVGLVVFALRLLDVLVLIVFFFACFPILYGLVPTILFFLMSCLFVAIITIFGMAYFSITHVNQPEDSLTLLQRIGLALRKIIQDANKARVVGLTVLLWIVMLVVTKWMLDAILVNLGWLKTTALYLLKFPVDLLPIKGFANFGSHETAYFIIMRLLDEQELAPYASFASHIAMLAIAYTAAISASLILVIRAFWKR